MVFVVFVDGEQVLRRVFLITRVTVSVQSVCYETVGNEYGPFSCFPPATRNGSLCLWRTCHVLDTKMGEKEEKTKHFGK